MPNYCSFCPQPKVTMFDSLLPTPGYSQTNMILSHTTLPKTWNSFGDSSSGPRIVPNENSMPTWHPFATRLTWKVRLMGSLRARAMEFWRIILTKRTAPNGIPARCWNLRGAPKPGTPGRIQTCQSYLSFGNHTYCLVAGNHRFCDTRLFGKAVSEANQNKQALTRPPRCFAGPIGKELYIVEAYKEAYRSLRRKLVKRLTAEKVRYKV